jgi:hypothetical protein
MVSRWVGYGASHWQVCVVARPREEQEAAVRQYTETPARQGVPEAPWQRLPPHVPPVRFRCELYKQVTPDGLSSNKVKVGTRRDRQSSKGAVVMQDLTPFTLSFSAIDNNQFAWQTGF